MSADQTQEQTLTHQGGAFGSSNVERMNNQVSPVDKSPVIAFEGPQEYQRTLYVGRAHQTNFIPRTVESKDYSGNATFTVASRIQPVAGEPDMADQPYPAVEAATVTGDNTTNELEITNVDYAANTVTVDDTNLAAGDTLKLYPIVTEGTAQYRGVNQFGQVEGPADRWETPLYTWHDMEQDKRGTRVHLQGRIEFQRNERFELVVESPHQIVWEDADYPSAYVSLFEQKVEVTL